MPLPRKVVIASKVYKIGRTGDMTVHGITHLDTKVILVNTKFPDARHTLMHEILHAIWHEYQIKHRKDSEERIVMTLENAIIQVLGENPKVRKYILGI